MHHQEMKKRVGQRGGEEESEKRTDPRVRGGKVLTEEKTGSKRGSDARGENESRSTQPGTRNNDRGPVHEREIIGLVRIRSEQEISSRDARRG